MIIEQSNSKFANAVLKNESDLMNLYFILNKVVRIVFNIIFRVLRFHQWFRLFLLLNCYIPPSTDKIFGILRMFFCCVYVCYRKEN